VLGSARQRERKKGLEPGVACQTSFVDGPAAEHRVDGHGRTSTADGQGVTGVGPSELSWDVEESPGTIVNKGKSCRSIEVLKTMTHMDHGRVLKGLENPGSHSGIAWMVTAITTGIAKGPRASRTHVCQTTMANRLRLGCQHILSLKCMHSLLT
jgi:hypothetical protein